MNIEQQAIVEILAKLELDLSTVKWTILTLKNKKNGYSMLIQYLKSTKPKEINEKTEINEVHKIMSIQ